jgi:hypothetical protein
MSDHSMDLVVFGIVVGLRVIVPLFIPRFPLPAVLLAMVIDAADQTIFQNLTDLNLDNYQSYDKALDIFYLAIAFLATMRNWTNHVAFDTSRFLWYYRLVGVTAFELTHTRALLLIFPNTFEYFFDAIEAARTKWDPRRLSKRAVIGIAAFIWIFIKLPQEYWIHIAQLDTTDLIKEDLFGVSVDTPFSEIIADNVLFFVGLGLLLAALIVGLKYVFDHKLPPPDWKLAFDADARGRDVSDEQVRQQVASMRGRVFTIELAEKVFLLALVMIIFTRIVPGTASEPWEQAVGVAIFLVLNTVVSELIIRWRGYSIDTAIGQFVLTFAVNAGIVAALWALLPGDRSFHWAAALFLGLLLSILIALYDRYRPIYLARFGDDRFEHRLAERMGVPG